MNALFGGGPTRKYNRAEKKVEKAKDKVGKSVAKVEKAKANFKKVEGKIISKIEKGANRIIARRSAKK
jgi:hypothetical protein